MKTRKLFYGPVTLRLICVLSLIAISLMSGCSKHGDSRGATEVKARSTVLLVYVDRSGSISSYRDGRLDGIRKDYARISQAFLKPVLQSHDDVLVEARAFVRDDIVLFSKRADKWEQVREPLFRECRKRPYREVVASKTLFSVLIDQIGARCKSHKDEDYYVLVLTDGHPDEPFAEIEASVKRFAEGKHDNLKCVMVAPVLPDMKMRWREKLEAALTPLGVAAVANNEDFRAVCEEVRNQESN